LRGAVYFRADESTISRFQDEGSKPFQYTARGKVVVVGSYWQLPDRLYDDPEELAQWARSALSAAERAALGKRSGNKPHIDQKTVVTKGVKNVRREALTSSSMLH
jgi:DNA transformation protein